jgi:hypothetical protein
MSGLQNFAMLGEMNWVDQTEPINPLWEDVWWFGAKETYHKPMKIPD